jgi:hypothetical protein
MGIDLGILNKIFTFGRKKELKDLGNRLERLKAAMPADIVAAHEHASQHRTEVLSGEQCGCFYCGATFPPAEITKWVDNGGTALCPRCGIDAVLSSASGLPLSKNFLDQMNKHWF